MKIHEYIVVGSGCSGAMSAQTLVESGAEVAILDAGYTPEQTLSVPKGKSYNELRHNDKQQYRYLIGERAEGVVWGDIGKGAQITPPRSHMVAGTDTYIPLESKTFLPVESLGYGGLGIGWGLQCWEYSAEDMAAAGLDRQKMLDAYETVSKRIGVSGTKDPDASYTLGELHSYQPSPHMDRNHKRIYKKYDSRRKQFNREGFYLSRTPLALITKELNQRQKYAYRDLDFYSDNDKSAWRPWITIDALRRKKNCHYIGGYLVVSFKETPEHIEVHCLKLNDNTPETFYCRKLVLASGALGSGRIALRSLGKPAQKLPLLCNPYTYIPCLQPAMMGKGYEDKKLGFAQLSLFFDKEANDTNLSVASLYSYQSLMMFRVIRQIPFNFIDSRKIMDYLMPGIVIMGVHHPDMASDKKYIKLVRDTKTPTGDRLVASYQPSDDELSMHHSREKKFISAARKLGIFPLAKINPGYGSSIHYAGTLPFSDTDKPLTLSRDGKLHGTDNVFVADSSGFTYLPARGLTFSLLANAHTVAEGLIHAS